MGSGTTAAKPQLQRSVKRSEALPYGIAPLDVESALELLNPTSVVLCRDFRLLEASSEIIVPMPEVLNYLTALLRGQAVLYPAPFPLCLFW